MTSTTNGIREQQTKRIIHNDSCRQQRVNRLIQYGIIIGVVK